MKITQELRASDYYLFIDFLRKNSLFKRKKDKMPISLFTHQELALAYNLGFEEFIALRERGTPTEGFLRYVQSNPEEFSNEAELLQKIESMVRERNWNKDYSRNLVVEDVSIHGPFQYADHTGQANECIWQAKVENRRIDTAAVNTTCILDSIEVNGITQICTDRSNLKWARQKGYQKTILPKDFGFIDIFSVRQSAGIFLHSALDVIPRQPILVNSGTYRLNYKVFSETFPLLYFSIEVNYQQPTPSCNIRNLATAKIV